MKVLSNLFRRWERRHLLQICERLNNDLMKNKSIISITVKVTFIDPDEPPVYVKATGLNNENFTFYDGIRLGRVGWNIKHIRSVEVTELHEDPDHRDALVTRIAEMCLSARAGKTETLLFRKCDSQNIYRDWYITKDSRCSMLDGWKDDYPWVTVSSSHEGNVRIDTVLPLAMIYEWKNTYKTIEVDQLPEPEPFNPTPDELYKTLERYRSNPNNIKPNQVVYSDSDVDSSPMIVIRTHEDLQTYKGLLFNAEFLYLTEEKESRIVRGLLCDYRRVVTEEAVS